MCVLLAKEYASKTFQIHNKRKRRGIIIVINKAAAIPPMIESPMKTKIPLKK